MTILKKRDGGWKDKTKSSDLFEAKAKPKLTLSYSIDEGIIPFQVVSITELRNLIPKEYFRGKA